MQILQLLGYIIGLLIVLTLTMRIYNTFFVSEEGRLRAIARWAADVKFSNAQLTAMRSLWQWYKSGHAPAGDVLAMLNPGEMSDLIAKCEPTFLPERLQSADVEKTRKRLLKELKVLGMDDIQAQIVASMLIAQFGPARDV